MEPLESDEQTRRAKLRLGERLIDKWLLEELIGIGGMAAVYAASHRNGKRVAIKVMHRVGALGEESRARFLREGLVANTVGHKGAVSVLDEDVTEDGAPFFVMDLFEGETLESRLRRKGPLAVGDVLSAAYHLLDVLAAAHEKGIVHRDIKPANVFLTKDASVKVLDFGIAQLREIAGTGTKVGHAMGTPWFMAPEQARGRWDEVDARSDLWSVGATMFTLLTGRYVHEAQTLNEVLLGAMTLKAEPIALHRPELSRASCEVVDRALAFAPSDRWQTAREMQRAIGAAYDALRSSPAGWAHPPTLMATSVSTPGGATAAAQLALPPPRPAATARPTVGTTGESDLVPSARGHARTSVAVIGAMGLLAIASWMAATRAGGSSHVTSGPSARSATTAPAFKPPPPFLADPPVPPGLHATSERASNALPAASPAPPAAGDPATPLPPAPTPMHVRPRHVASATLPAPSAAASAANLLDRRH